MNQRIKELALQAGYTKDMFGIGHWDMPECQKFAELIVLDICKWIDDSSTLSEKSIITTNIKNRYGAIEE